MSGIIRKEDMHESFWKEGVSSSNLLINGDFQIWQRGTNFSNILKSYTADRWVVHSSSQVDVIKEGQSLKISKPTTNTNTNITANLWQILEKPNSLRKKTVVLSFTARSSADLSIVCSIGVGNDFDGSTNIIRNTVKLTKNGNLYSTVFDLSNHNWETDSNICVNFRFSNFEQIWISQVKLEIGNNATPFTPRPYGEELALCQRYYISGNYKLIGLETHFSSNILYYMIPLPVSMRSKPTLTDPSKVKIVKLNTINDNHEKISPKNVDVGDIKCNEIAIAAILPSHGITVTSCITLYDDTGYCGLDAEIY